MSMNKEDVWVESIPLSSLKTDDQSCESALDAACAADTEEPCKVCSGRHQRALKVAGCSNADIARYCDHQPEPKDVCAMLAQELPPLGGSAARRLTPFLSGNLMNYLGGQSGPDWTPEAQEEETLGLTHAYHWD